MWEPLVHSLKSINWVIVISLLGLTGGFIVFIIWGWRRNNLELEKLRREIEELKRKDSQIYIPTNKEIEDILRKAEQLTRMTGDATVEGQRPVSDFGELLRYLLNYTLAYSYGDKEAWKTLRREQSNEYLRNLYYSTMSSFDTPKPEIVYEKWKEVQTEVRSKLSKFERAERRAGESAVGAAERLDETVRAIDLLLNRLVVLQKITPVGSGVERIGYESRSQA